MSNIYYNYHADDRTLDDWWLILSRLNNKKTILHNLQKKKRWTYRELISLVQTQKTIRNVLFVHFNLQYSKKDDSLR